MESGVLPLERLIKQKKKRIIKKYHTVWRGYSLYCNFMGNVKETPIILLTCFGDAACGVSMIFADSISHTVFWHHIL